MARIFRGDSGGNKTFAPFGSSGVRRDVLAEQTPGQNLSPPARGLISLLRPGFRKRQCSFVGTGSPVKRRSAFQNEGGTCVVPRYRLRRTNRSPLTRSRSSSMNRSGYSDSANPLARAKSARVSSESSEGVDHLPRIFGLDDFYLQDGPDSIIVRDQLESACARFSNRRECTWSLDGNLGRSESSAVVPRTFGLPSLGVRTDTDLSGVSPTHRFTDGCTASRHFKMHACPSQSQVAKKSETLKRRESFRDGQHSSDRSNSAIGFWAVAGFEYPFCEDCGRGDLPGTAACCLFRMARLIARPPGASGLHR